MKKNTILIVLLLQVWIPNLIAQTATPPAAGDGSVGNPYQIGTLENLYWLSLNSAEWDKNYIQTDDIYASATNTWDVGDHDSNSGTPDEAMGFSPIGSGILGDTSFTGTYNGKGHSINSLYINRPSGDFVGFFGRTDAASIDSLYLSVTITGGDITGGLVGGNGSGTTISQCSTSGTITGASNVGGLIGQDISLAVGTSFSNASVTGINFVGGFIGNASGSEISNCYTIGGPVNSTGVFSGGFIGYNDVGTTVSNSYCASAVNGANFFGGFMGNNDGTVTNCYWDTFWGQATSAAGTPKDHVEMKTLTTFTNTTWDFLYETTNGTNDFWRMPCGGGNYPRLSWQDNSIFSAEGTDTRTECGSYVWIDGNTYTTNNNTATYTLVGATLSGCDSIVTLDLTIVNTISDLTTSTSGATITANNAAASYVWLDCDNNNAVIAGETGQSFTATANGNYAVQFTENTCVDTSLCTAISIIGIEEVHFSNDFAMYPNPTHDIVTIELSDFGVATSVELRDARGRLMEAAVINTASKTLNLSRYDAGVYFVVVSFSNGEQVQRIVKQ